MDFNAWVNKLYVKMDFDLGYSQITDPADPDIGTRALFACDNRVPVPFANGAGYCNREVDSLFARAARTPDTATRIVLYDKAQQLIVRDQPNFFLVGGIGSPFAWSDKFAGVDAAGAKSPYYFGQTTYSTSGSTSPPSGK